MSILRMLCFAYLNILFSLAFIYLKAKHWYFSILFNKKIKDFQGQFSRPWNWTPEIQGFSRHVQTLSLYAVLPWRWTGQLKDKNCKIWYWSTWSEWFDRQGDSRVVSWCPQTRFFHQLWWFLNHLACSN